MADTRGAFFRWQYQHPAEARCECGCIARAAAFAAGVAHGKRVILEASAEWSQLTPLLGAVLEELATLNEDRAIERAVAESDMRPAF